MGQLNAGILIDGVIDGTTVGYTTVVDYDSNRPLEQWVNEAGVCTPDWAAAWADLQNGVTAAKMQKVPRIYIRARDLTTGADLTNTLRISEVGYNGTTTPWNPGSTAFGLIRMVDADDATYGKTYGGKGVPSVMVTGNPADAITNPDNDRISFSGSVVADGGQVRFKDLGKDIDIHPELSAGAGYSVKMTVPDETVQQKAIDSYIYDKDVPTKRIVQLFHEGSPVDPTAKPHIFEFEDVTGDTDVPLAAAAGLIGISTTTKDGYSVNGNTITIYPDAVDSMMTMRCNCYAYDGGVKGDLIACGLAVIYDMSDEFQVKWQIADDAAFSNSVEYVSDANKSEGPRYSLRSGDTKYLKPIAINGTTGEALAGNHTWRFNADDPNAKAAVDDMADANINNMTAGQTYCYLEYGDVVKTYTDEDTGELRRRRRPVLIHAQTTI